MSDVERVLGSLLEFKKTHTRDMQEVKQKLEDLYAFRWKIAGAAALGGSIIGGIVSAILELAYNHVHF